MHQSHEKNSPSKQPKSEKRAYNAIKAKTLHRGKLREIKRNVWK